MCAGSGAACREVPSMEQLQILHEILAAERSAREDVASARREKAEIDRDQECLRQRLKEDAEARAREAIEEARGEELSRVQAELEQLRVAHEEKLASLERRFRDGRDVWTEKIFRMVVGLDDQ